MKKALTFLASVAVHAALLALAMALTIGVSEGGGGGGFSVGLERGREVGFSMTTLEPRSESWTRLPQDGPIEPELPEFQPLDFDPVPSDRGASRVSRPTGFPPTRDHARFAGAVSGSEKEGGSTGRGDGSTRAAPVVETDAVLIDQPSPVYPRRAREKRLEGSVVIRFDVLGDGTTGNLRVETTSGHPILDDAALEAVRKYRYTPATRNGRPVTCTREVPITFKLK